MLDFEGNLIGSVGALDYYGATEFSFSADGKFIYGWQDSRVLIFDTVSFEELARFDVDIPPPESDLQNLFTSDDGQTLFLIGSGDIQIVDLGLVSLSLSGEGGDDVLVGYFGDDVFEGRGGNDIFDGNGGDDTYYGGAGFDIVTYVFSRSGVTVDLAIFDAQKTGDGSDLFSSIEGIVGSAFNDRLFGDSLNNLFNGSAGNDRILGMEGDDLFIDGSGSGNDIYDGGNGVDSIDYSTAQGSISIDLGQSINNASGADIGSDSLASIESVIAGQGDDSILGNDAANILIGGLGDDTLFGLNGADLLYGGDGNDVIVGGRQNDIIYGDAGNDIILGELGVDILYGGAGDDLVLGGNRDDQLFGEDGNDRTFGGNGNDIVDSGAGEDIVRGGSQDDILNGGAGNDVVFGGTGRDDISGGDGNDLIFGRGGFDVLNGGAGDDILEGGVQADQFVFQGAFGNDTITDFSATNNAERINLSAVSEISDFQDLIDNHLRQIGNDVLIDDLAGNTITLKGVQLSDLDAVDFVF